MGRRAKRWVSAASYPLLHLSLSDPSSVVRTTGQCLSLRPAVCLVHAHKYDVINVDMFTVRQRLWLCLGVNIDDQLWLRLNPIPIPNYNPSANPSPSRNPN